MQGYCLNCSNISKYVRGEFHGKIVKTVGIFFGQSNFLTITPSEWRLGKKFKQFFKNLLPLMYREAEFDFLYIDSIIIFRRPKEKRNQ